jgi:RimJ/RimL family protein N-acetyltransferase
MRSLDCTTLFLPLICRELGYIPTSAAQCIVCLDDGEPVAGAVYDNYTGKTIAAHIWIKSGGVPSRAWYGAIFDYPFNRLGVYKIIGQVKSVNLEAIRLDEHFGFVLEATVRGYYEDGDLLVYTMTKDQCRVLNSKRWFSVAEVVRRVA